MMRVAITTLGCKANWSDSEAIAQRLAAAGISIVDFKDEADIYVVNTCTVTGLASAQSRQMLRRAIKGRSGSIVLATGCCGEMERGELSRIPGVERVFGTSDRDVLISYILERVGSEAAGVDDRRLGFGPVAGEPQSRARAFLKIQDGCDRRCAYCIITQARGVSRSLPPDEVLRVARALGGHHNEIILTGIDIGQYGRDLPDRTPLVELVRELTEDAGVPRVRLSSLAPDLVDDGLVALISGGGICRHLHLSIQSCSDALLRSMRRGYGGGDVRRAALALSSGVPGTAITGDLIAGLPGEGEADHEATLRILEGLPIAGLHVFPYSPREGTEAASMPDQVPDGTRHRRAAELRSLARKKRAAFLDGLIGEPMDVIVTSRRAYAGGKVKTFSDNAVEIELPAGVVEYGGMGRAVITGLNELAAQGRWR